MHLIMEFKKKYNPMTILKHPDKLEAKLKVYRAMPSLNEIYTRMQARYGRSAPLVQSVIYPCAQEAELMLMELKEFEELKNTVKIKRRNKATFTDHYCGCCGCKTVKGSHTYCHRCGSKIQWV